MTRCTVRTWTFLVLAFTVAAFPNLAFSGEDEDQVKETWKAFQGAIKARDGEKVWDLLDASSRAAAEKFAKRYKAKYAKADDAAKKELEKDLELTGAELAGLTPQLFLKSKRYYGKYNEVPGSKLEKIAIDGAKATLFYLEEDGDKEKLGLVREDGKWKLSAPPP